MAELALDDEDGAVQQNVGAQLEELRKQYGDRIPLGAVGVIVTSLLQTLRGQPCLSPVRLHDELEALAHYIERAKREITAIRADDIRAKHIPLASGELDAIGAHLEEATGTILNSCEQLGAIGCRVGGEVETGITAIVTRVYEACSFQDITGQRITKLVGTLRTIEERIGQLLALVSHELGQELQPLPDAPLSRDGGASLLNGPQLSGSGNSQADIDALLAALT